MINFVTPFTLDLYGSSSHAAVDIAAGKSLRDTAKIPKRKTKNDQRTSEMLQVH